MVMTGQAERRVTAIITARGGSQGLPGKNIRPLAGRPLIVHSISAAQQCGGVAEVVVTTDDARIRDISVKAGAQVIDRPAALATATASSADAVVHAVDKLSEMGRRPDVIALLQPTSPLRTAAHLRDALSLFVSSGATSVVAVCPCEHHPFKTLLHTGGAWVPSKDWGSLEAARQSLPAAWRANGAIYIIETQAFMRERHFFVAPFVAFQMSTDDSIDIDTEADFQAAERALLGRGEST
jgi:CMP-N-acetylneuraminic acid synthetase